MRNPQEIMGEVVPQSTAKYAGGIALAAIVLLVVIRVSFNGK